MSSRKDNKIIIVHASEIIRHGLHHIIHDKFDIDMVLLNDLEDLKNYQSITNSTILLLIEAKYIQQKIDKIIYSLDQSNSFHTVLIRDRSDEKLCEENCRCCFSVVDSKTKIYDLLESYLLVKNGMESQNSSTSLTEREIEVVKLVANGRTNKEIADNLFISFHTVISHRKNITEKLGIKSISGLTVYAILNNLIDASSIDLG